MSWADPLSFMTNVPPYVFILTVFLVISIPLILHLIIYSTTSDTLPTFLLLGPSGAGKTSLVTLFERGRPVATRTSQVTYTVEVSLPVKTPVASSRFRSPNDPSWEITQKLLIQDTPGHGKLRHLVFDSLGKTRNLQGIIFMVDAADLSSSGGDSSEGLRQAAEYLHDLLLLLQKRATASKTAKAPKQMPLLIAANKVDLFTALPASLVKTALETEITKVRISRNKGLLDSSDNLDADEEREWLGDGGDGPFDFSQMEEVNVPVKVLGGNVIGGERPDIKQWWDWLGSIL